MTSSGVLRFRRSSDVGNSRSGSPKELGSDRDYRIKNVIINGDLMVTFNEIMVNDIQLIFTSHPVLANDCHIQ
jgi:hypothetical protein